MDGTPMSVQDWAGERSEVDTHTFEGDAGTDTGGVAVAEEGKDAGAAAGGTGTDAAAQAAEAGTDAGTQAEAAKAGAAAAAAGATPAQQREVIEAVLDGKPFQIPKGVTFKLKAGATSEDRKIEDLLSGGMRELDYRRKTTDVARRVRDLDNQSTTLAARQKALDARDAWLKEQQQEMAEAMKDPAKWEQYQELQRLAQSNPRVAKMLEDAIAKRETDARMEVFEEAKGREEVNHNVQSAMGWIEELSKDPQYAMVDPERVRFLHSRELTSNPNWDNTPEHIASIFQAEAKYLSGFSERLVSPLQKQLDEMKAQLAARAEEEGRGKHNARTARALDRSKATSTAPVARTPPGPRRVEPPKPIPPNRQAHEAAVQEWANRRDE